MKNHNIKNLRIFAFLEGVSFLTILFITMPLKYLFDVTLPNKIVGYVHGVLFVAYIILVLRAGNNFRWSKLIFFKALIASIIPFGTFWADKNIFQNSEQRKN